MEFPDLGKHCSSTECKQLDFLPMKCDACSEIFCRDHIRYVSHNCPESYKKDNQVPVCPLCNEPISVKRNEMPDVIVGQHIDNDCQSDKACKRRKWTEDDRLKISLKSYKIDGLIYTNRCSKKGCKQKELIPVTCDKCRKNFCLKHRHETDHDCHGFENTGRSMSSQGAAAIFRAQSNRNSSNEPSKPQPSKAKPQQTSLTHIGGELDRQRRERQTGPSSVGSRQAGMSEDEALARAIQLSMAESQAPAQQTTSNKPLTRQEQEDLMLAQAIAASQEEANRQQRRRRQPSGSDKKSACTLS